jgi:ABC-type spermidine/putrescine transport system permease subunit I
MAMRISFIERSPIAKSLILLGPALLILLFLYFYPVVRMLYSSFFQPDFTLQNYAYFFQKPLYLKILLRTFKIAFLVTAIALIVAYPLAMFLAEAKGKATYLMVCVILPFWTSVLVRTYAWMVLLQFHGLINKILIGLGIIAEPLHIMYNTPAVLVGMVHVLLPFMVLSIYSVLKGIDPSLKLAAYTLGANKVTAFMRVTLPLSLPGVLAGVIFVFVLSLGFFITPALLGGPKVMMIATLIESQINDLNNWNFAAAIALILLTCTIVILGAFFNVINLDRMFGEKKE